MGWGKWGNQLMKKQPDPKVWCNDMVGSPRRTTLSITTDSEPLDDRNSVRETIPYLDEGRRLYCN